MNLQDYSDKVKSFETNMRQAVDIAAELNMQNAVYKSENILSLIGTEAFHLVIVGEFSRGKSTFVNALLGKKILPATKKPTTAVISKIIYSRQPQYRIFHKNNRVPQNLSEQEFLKLTAPKEPDASDPQSVREYDLIQKEIDSIDYAEIGQPLKFCRDNVEVVDTPGTNDLNLGRMEITYGYLNQADACILLLSATQPLSKSEAEFLKERILGNKIQDIFFVISGRDRLHGNKDEERRVITFVERNLTSILPANFNLQNRLFLVSGRTALLYRRKQNGEVLKPKYEAEIPANFEETGFIEFETALGNFLSNDKGAVKLNRYIRDVKKIFAMIYHDLSIKIDMVSHSADDIRKKVPVMENKFRKAKQDADKIIRKMKFNFENAGNNIESNCISAAQSIRMKAKASVNNLDESMSDCEMKDFIESAVTSEKKNFIDNTISDWRQIFDSNQSAATDALKKIWYDIDVQYRREFNLSALNDDYSLSLDIEIDRSESFSERSYSTAGKLMGQVFDSGRNFLERVGSFIGGLITGAVGFVSDVYNKVTGSSSKKDWREQIRNTIDKTYKSLDKDMTRTLTKQYNADADDICRRFQAGINARIDDMDRQLKDILREKESREQDVARQKNYLTVKQNQLRQLEKNLDALQR